MSHCMRTISIAAG